MIVGVRGRYMCKCWKDIPTSWKDGKDLKRWRMEKLNKRCWLERATWQRVQLYGFKHLWHDIDKLLALVSV